jgi:hypothetical protein
MKCRILKAGFAQFGLLLLFTGYASAQQHPGSARPFPIGEIGAHTPTAAISPAEAYGPGAQVTIIPPVAFTPGSSSYQFSDFFGSEITPLANGEQRWFAPLGLPSGAIVQELDVFVADNDAVSDIAVYALVQSFPVSGPGTCGGSTASATSSGISGQGIVAIANPWGTFPLTGRGICNSVDSYEWYMINVYLETTSHSFSGARVVWTRSISPAPVTATFNDVPTSNPLFQYVEALAASGITVGCGGGNYCPNNPLTRGQMAVYLAKALGLNWPQ